MGEPQEPEKFGRSAFADGPRLVAVIGATHARLALQRGQGVVRSVRVLKCDDFDGIVSLLRF
jgi:glucokinase